MPELRLKQDPWPPELVEKLKELRARGDSTGQIAKALGNGITRNAVIGKCIRMGFSHPGSKVAGTRAHGMSTSLHFNAQPKFKAKPAPPPPPTKEPKSFLIDGRRVTLLDLTDSTCRWPKGDPHGDPDFHFCGHKPRPGSVYCDYHFGVSRTVDRRAYA